jgi:hypothetical protein
MRFTYLRLFTDRKISLGVVPSVPLSPTTNLQCLSLQCPSVTLSQFNPVTDRTYPMNLCLATIATLGHMVRETRNDHPGKARHAGKTTTNSGEYVCCQQISVRPSTRGAPPAMRPSL